MHAISSADLGLRCADDFSAYLDVFWCQVIAFVTILVGNEHDVRSAYWIVFYGGDDPWDEVVFDLLEINISILAIGTTTAVAAGNNSSAISSAVFFQPFRQSLVRFGRGELSETISRHLSTSWGNWSVGFDSHGWGRSFRSIGTFRILRKLFVEFGEVDFFGLFFEADAGDFRWGAFGVHS